MKSVVIIGSRGSKLALWQAEFLQAQLLNIGFASEIRIIKTQGDIIQHLSLDKLEGKGFFTKEIEQSLLQGEIDVAVHSHKDLPTEETPGLIIAGVSEREDAAELLLIRKEKVDATQPLSLPANAVVGTSAARRKCQLLHFRKDIHLKDIRGNVTTRVDKLRAGQFDAILLAAAGMNRLGLDLSDLHIERLEPWTFIPSAAQGILAYQTRMTDEKMIKLIQKIADPTTKVIAETERKVMSLLGGGCQHPIGVYVKKKDDHYQMWVMRAKEWDDKSKRYYFIEKSPAHLIATIAELSKTEKPENIFISREMGKASYFEQYLTGFGHKVTGQSLVDFKPIEFKPPKAFDWIFFSSRNAVRFFFSNAEVKNYLSDHSIKIAAIGKGTADEVKTAGYSIDFFGTDADTLEVAKEFEKVANSKTILFPQAKNSLQTIQKQLGKSIKRIDLVVYDNVPVEKKDLPHSSFDVLVFTSPMNVSAYIANYKILPHHKVVAIGNTTAQALTEAGVAEYKVAYEPSEVALADTVMGI